MNRTLSTAFALAAALVFASPVFAQRGGDGGFGGQQRGGFNLGRMMNSGSALVGRPDVQKDLKLTDAQKADLLKIQTEMGEKIRATFSGGQRGGDRGGANGAAGTRGGDRGGFDMSQIETLQKEADAKVNAVLTPQQVARLGQIKVQLAGPRIVIDDDAIAKKLGVKANQKIQINKLIQAQNDANQQIFAKMRDEGVDRDALMAEVRKNDDILKAEIAKVLTADQQKALAEMQGPKFEADPNAQPGFGRGGGGGSTGGGGG